MENLNLHKHLVRINTQNFATYTYKIFYCTGLMSSPICHCRYPCCTTAVDTFCLQLSTCIGHAALPSIPVSACHNEKASPSSCTAPTTACLRGTLALVPALECPLRGFPKCSFYWRHQWFQVKRTRTFWKCCPTLTLTAHSLICFSWASWLICYINTVWIITEEKLVFTLTYCSA